ncbi:LexA family transcriptional regulator [Ectopseudomonas mendocina]|uniref:DNA polymerase V n=1 Tax=Ectopseudomonas mendocina TaxID=300 RepID=A0A2R3QVH4_ECTME|nr:translesion error-prone DNA polymerase V autoproteolytic subunit [Pseudomonas mendocina]AVO55754.1 DNA polymerase V [Pseudomonas mendocina]
MPLTLLGRLALPSRPLPLFLCRVSAGFPSPAEDHVDANLSLDDLCVQHPAATFFLRVRGDSMRDLGVFDGDIVVVDRSIAPRVGMVVVALVNGAFTCKQLGGQGGRPVLHAANPAYPDIHLSEGEELEIFGVVTNCIHKLPGV